MIYKAIYSICFSLTFLAPAAAQALTLCGKSAQGEVLTAYAPGAVKVELNGKSYPVTPDGKFIFAFGRDEASSAKLTVSYSDGLFSHRCPLPVGHSKPERSPAA